MFRSKSKKEISALLSFLQIHATQNGVFFQIKTSSSIICKIDLVRGLKIKPYGLFRHRAILFMLELNFYFSSIIHYR